MSEAEAADLSAMIEARRALPAPRSPSSAVSARGHDHLPRWKDAAVGPPPGLCRRSSPAGSRWPSRPSWPWSPPSTSAEAAARSSSITSRPWPASRGPTVKRALREAQALGLVRIEERRLSAWRNAPNVVTITSPEWSTWLRMRRKGVGFNSEPPRIQENKKGTSAQRNRTWAAEGQGPRRARLQPTRECIGEESRITLTQSTPMIVLNCRSALTEDAGRSLLFWRNPARPPGPTGTRCRGSDRLAGSQPRRR